MKKEYVVRVPVATIWTDRDKPREIDQPAISYPAYIKKWLENMTTADRKSLTDENLVQTQVLYGQVVTLIEEKSDWLHVYVNDQPSSKLNDGYPGWLPKSQVIKRSKTEMRYDAPFAVIISPKAWLIDGQEKFLELSYQTRLPLAKEPNEDEEQVSVNTPHGKLKLNHADVTIYSSESSIPKPTGVDLVKSGEVFKELPYLWGGMSGFGFDCSGFTYSIHRAWGITIPRDASDQEKTGSSVDRKDLMPGDLVYFAKEEGKGNVYHVGIYYGNGQMLHAPSAGKGIEIVPIEHTKYEKNYCSARRFW
ncbi:peptidase [Salipaludibacillus keqinensis]|uniref:Peptidase n=1 Tax=Salipaludibacillus keqinensis TaxID=2045207 RepID=A0A323TCI8_9BACI|nr:C40 family peptidase [Salipaludibacillus keqinensis]PYZ92386.1 peptidase [Salipaludibacillus keqinensis]